MIALLTGAGGGLGSVLGWRQQPKLVDGEGDHCGLIRLASEHFGIVDAPMISLLTGASGGLGSVDSDHFDIVDPRSAVWPKVSDGVMELPRR